LEDSPRIVGFEESETEEKPPPSRPEYQFLLERPTEAGVPYRPPHREGIIPSRKPRTPLSRILTIVCFVGLAASTTYLTYVYLTHKDVVIVIREIPFTTYHTRTVTSTATLTRTVASSSAALSTITKESLIATSTLTRYDTYTSSLIVTTTETLVTVTGSVTSTVLVRTTTFTFSFTTSSPITYFHAISTVITETTTRWTSFDQTTVFTTIVTSTLASASTYTQTTTTTMVTAPPGAAIAWPNVPNQARGLVEFVLCSAFVAGMLVFRKQSSCHRRVKRCV